MVRAAPRVADPMQEPKVKSVKWKDVLRRTAVNANQNLGCPAELLPAAVQEQHEKQSEALEEKAAARRHASNARPAGNQRRRRYATRAPSASSFRMLWSQSRQAFQPLPTPQR